MNVEDLNDVDSVWALIQVASNQRNIILIKRAIQWLEQLNQPIEEKCS